MDTINLIYIFHSYRYNKHIFPSTDKKKTFNYRNLTVILLSWVIPNMINNINGCTWQLLHHPLFLL